MDGPDWLGMHVANPFAWLLAQKLKSVETRMDWRDKPEHLPGQPAGTFILVHVKDVGWPSKRGAELAEHTANCILSRKELVSRQQPACVVVGRVCIWVQIGESFKITQEEADRRGGWAALEDMSLLSRKHLQSGGTVDRCRWGTIILDAGVMRRALVPSSKSGLFEMRDNIARSDLLPLPRARPPPATEARRPLLPAPEGGAGSMNNLSISSGSMSNPSSVSYADAVASRALAAITAAAATMVHVDGGDNQLPVVDTGDARYLALTEHCTPQLLTAG